MGREDVPEEVSGLVSTVSFPAVMLNGLVFILVLVVSRETEPREETQRKI